MAYIDDTLLLDFQATEATNEKRKQPYGLVDATYDSTNAVDFIPPSVKDLMSKVNSTRNARIPYLKDQSVTVTSVPGYDKIPVNLGETGEYYFSAYDVWSGFSMYESTFAQNSVDAKFYFNNIMSNVLQGMASAKENIIKTVLEAQKTQLLNFTAQVSETALDYDFNTSTDTLEVKKAAQNDTLFYNLQRLMAANDLAGVYNLITSRAALTISDAEAMKYGVNNNKNIEWAQAYMSESNRYESSNIAPTERWDGYLVKDGAIGMYSNYPYNFRNGKEFGGNKFSIAPTELPFIKSRPNIFTRETAADATGLIAGSDQIMSSREEIAIWDRFYLVYPVNSDISTRVNPIVKIQALTA